MSYFIVQLCNYVNIYMLKRAAIVSTSFFYKFPLRDECVYVWLWLCALTGSASFVKSYFMAIF